MERFCELAFFYGVPPDRLLGEALEASAPVGRTRLVVDLTQLSAIDAPEIETLADFLHQVRSQRHDLLSDVISLRSGDLEAMALAAGKEPRVLLSRVRRALRGL